jgi:DNA-binding transcriptional regulator GbsR (MarR family)
MSISDSERCFIEEVGVAFEQTGLTRMSGRLIGWLLISDPPYQSPAELAGALAASKGSISTSIRLLVQMGLIERHIIPRSRHDHFRLREDAITKIIRHGLEEEITMFRSLAECGLELTNDIPTGRKKVLKEMQSRYSYLEKAFPELLEKYERERREECEVS